MEDFPPFYTRQPNESTWLEQRQQWIQSILARCTQFKIWTIDHTGTITAASPSESQVSLLPKNLFHNPRINRRLDSATITEILTHMLRLNLLKPVKTIKKSSAISAVAGSGSGSSGSKYMGQSYLVYWNTPDQWASIILEWIERTGQSGSVLTLFELQNVQGEPFQDINEEMLRLALEVLSKRGRAVVMREDGVVMGVKVQ